jgi:hypothetical protein
VLPERRRPREGVAAGYTVAGPPRTQGTGGLGIGRSQKARNPLGLNLHSKTTTGANA